ncbi:MAG: hypothetical protein VKP57_07955 [Candidatus Sericytochromatia bacterium]|nr:hypothetical protein [Candidatus Sericytochromatia bacterium]
MSRETELLLQCVHLAGRLCLTDWSPSVVRLVGGRELRELHPHLSLRAGVRLAKLLDQGLSGIGPEFMDTLARWCRNEFSSRPMLLSRVVSWILVRDLEMTRFARVALIRITGARFRRMAMGRWRVDLEGLIEFEDDGETIRCSPVGTERVNDGALSREVGRPFEEAVVDGLVRALEAGLGIELRLMALDEHEAWMEHVSVSRLAIPEVFTSLPEALLLDLARDMSRRLRYHPLHRRIVAPVETWQARPPEDPEDNRPASRRLPQRDVIDVLVDRVEIARDWQGTWQLWPHGVVTGRRYKASPGTF